MPLAYFLSVTLHVLAAMLWLGGMFFLAVVGAPVLRKVQPLALRAELFEKIGVQFRWVGWTAIGVLIVTGILNLQYRHLLGSGVMGTAAFWSSAYGHALAWKLGSVTVLILLSLVHDFVIGPRASRYPAGSAEASRYRRLAAWMARASVLVGIVLVLAAVRVARGG